MKLLSNIWFYVSIGLGILLLMKQCGSGLTDLPLKGKATPIILKTKPYEGKFKAVTPQSKPIKYDHAETDQNNSPEIDSILLKANQELMTKIALYKVSDSIQKEQLYNKAIALTQSDTVFEDSMVKINVSGIASGQIKALNVDKYLIKPKSLKVKTYSILGLLETGSTTKLDKFNAKVNLMYVAPNSGVFSLGYDTNQFIYLGYGKKIFQKVKIVK